MSLFDSITGLLTDPPPAYAFELSERGMAVARVDSAPLPEFRPLPPDTISVSPLRDNVLVPERLAEAVRAASPSGAKNKRRDAAVILPDHCARISVLDFDEFPSDAKEQAALVRFRIRKSVPYDVEAASVSFWAQPRDGKKKLEVVAVIAPYEILTRYEAPFRAAGLQPGLVTVSSLAMLPLVDGREPTVVAKLSGRILTILVVDRNALRLVRCLEVPQAGLEEIAADLYPTFVYVEDQLGQKAQRLLLAGFGALLEPARQRFGDELGLPVAPVESRLGTPGEHNAGLLGYLQGVMHAA